jgi:hypothetical protein
MDKFERYISYRTFVTEKPRTFDEAYNKLHELYNDQNIDELQELGSVDDLFLYDH